MNFIKRILIFILLLIQLSISGFAQTATNFTSVNCSGTTCNLFTELEQGKVIVMCWVMPCDGCILGAKTSFDMVSSYQATYPNRVFFYLVDDIADSDCNILNNWANGPDVNVFENSYSFRFTDSTIKMSDYKREGMPKVVVLGGNNHTVFYNVNVNEEPIILDSLAAAIDSALIASNIKEFHSEVQNISLFPIPSNTNSTLSIQLNSSLGIKVELYNSSGNFISKIFNGLLQFGNNEINIDSSKLSNGVYSIKISTADQHKLIKLVVSH